VGKSRETVEDMMSELVARNRSDLLTLGYNFAGLVLTDPQDKHWLTERFTKVLMGLDILKESWVYLEGLAKLIIGAISDVDRLQALITDFSLVASQQDAQRLLLSLV
jgi:hypothetical protein